jgi:hypothetical protein
VLLTTLSAFSQTLILNKKDTSICFSINQAKYLLKEQYKVKECQTILTICEKQNALSDSIINNFRANNNSLKSVIFNQKSIIGLQDTEIDDLNDKISDEQRQVRKQKAYKWVSIGCGILASGFIGYKYLTK